MSGQRVGYTRVSSLGQNDERQLEGVPLDRVFTDKASGKDAERPQHIELLAYIREGDILLVHPMDRLARNLDDLRRLVRELTAKGLRIEFMKGGGLVFDGNDSPMSTLLLAVMGAVAEFELAHIRSRQLEGIALAKQRGVYRGRARALTPEQATEVCRRAAAGEKKTALAELFGVSRETVYKALREARSQI